MVKLLGAGFLMAGGVGLGMSAARRLTNRVTTLRSLTETLELLERELEFNLPMMQELMSVIARRTCGPAAAFLHACQEQMSESNGRTLAEIWQQAAVKWLPALKKCDLEVLYTVGAVLGRYDAESQRCSLAAAQERLSAHLQEAIEEQRRLGRVYSSLGAAAGAFLVILLL